MLREPALGRKLAEAGRRWVETQYDWRAVYPQFDAVYAGQGEEPHIRQ